MREQQKIAVLGCGWLGEPLTYALIEKGFDVKASVTSFSKMTDLRAKKIDAHQIEIDSESINGNITEFLKSDLLIVSIPPKRRPDIMDVYPSQIKQLIHYIENSPVRKVLFISSTSVYPNTNGIVDETFEGIPEKDSGKALLKAEKLLMENASFRTTVIRFGGLIGYDRLPARFLSGKTGLKDASSPVNLIHRDDCIQILMDIIEQESWGEIFNACAEYHPTRKEFYTKAAQLADIPLPEFLENESSDEFKIIDSSKIRNELGIKFKYPNPMDVLIESFSHE